MKSTFVFPRDWIAEHSRPQLYHWTIMWSSKSSCIRCLLRSFVLRWVALNPIRRMVLYHDCVTMLQTRFVIFAEIFVIRRKSIPKLLWMMNTVSSRFWATPARSSGSLRELTDFTVQIQKMQNHCACQLACLCLVLWTLTFDVVHAGSLVTCPTLCPPAVIAHHSADKQPQMCVPNYFDVTNEILELQSDLHANDFALCEAYTFGIRTFLFAFLF